jgi:hypothetical protein
MYALMSARSTKATSGRNEDTENERERFDVLM